MSLIAIIVNVMAIGVSTITGNHAATIADIVFLLINFSPMIEDIIKTT